MRGLSVVPELDAILRGGQVDARGIEAFRAGGTQAVLAFDSLSADLGDSGWTAADLPFDGIVVNALNHKSLADRRTQELLAKHPDEFALGAAVTAYMLRKGAL